MYGREISDAQIEEWVAEAEAGYDVDVLKKRLGGRPARGAQSSQVVPVRLTEAELNAVMTKAAAKNLNRSEAIRQALAAWAAA